ncbi:Uncharacterised protein [Candidatus Tiddalikarchaeum anstoanum]|nr:Uncharacterised protein [Candidatus Tiddalikarchaeum anstoanum]
MRKGEFFEPVYSIIFGAVVLSMLILFKTVISDWVSESLLADNMIVLKTSADLMYLFDKYEYNLNLSQKTNVTINSESIIFSKDNSSIKMDNLFGITSFEKKDATSLTIIKNYDVWVIS